MALKRSAPRAKAKAKAKAQGKATKPAKAAKQALAQAGATVGALADDIAQLHRDLAAKDARIMMLDATVDMLQAKIQVMREVARTSAGDFSLDEMLELFMTVVLSAMHADAGSLLLAQKDGTLLFKVTRGPKAGELQGRRIPGNEGIVGWVVQKGESVITEDAQRDKRFSSRIADELKYLPRNILAVPLKGRNGVLGVLELLNRFDGKPFVQDDLAALESLAVQMAMVIENAQLFQSNKEEIRHLTSLIEVSEVLNTTLDLKELLKKVMELAARTLGAEASSIFLLDPATGDLVVEVATGEKEDVVKAIRVPVGQGIVGAVAQTCKPVLVPDVSQDPRFFKKADEETKFKTRDILAVPLTVQGRLVGVVEVLNKAEGTFDEDDTRVLEALAHQSAIAIDNARLYADLKKSFEMTVSCLAEAIDAKDPYTAGHARRVTEFVVATCQELGLPRAEAETVRMSALMHDVGKIGVPEAILCKPGKLTDEEFGKMKLHPVVGEDILKPIPQLAEVVPGILRHHERFDGRGYPGGLQGEAIPLSGRIIGVSDSFDAMTSDRVYRPRLSDEVALEELRKCSGTQFDPKVVEAFLKAYQHGRIKTEHKPAN